MVREIFDINFVDKTDRYLHKTTKIILFLSRLKKNPFFVHIDLIIEQKLIYLLLSGGNFYFIISRV